MNMKICVKLPENWRKTLKCQELAQDGGKISTKWFTKLTSFLISALQAQFHNRAVFAKKICWQFFVCSHVHLWREGLCLDLGLSAVRLHPDGSQRQRPKSTD